MGYKAGTLPNAPIINRHPSTAELEFWASGILET
jgi:hypothetical protein